MEYSIQLTTKDQQLFEFTCESEQSVQEAAEANGLLLPAGCKSGACGSCFAHCQQGNYQLREHSEGILSANAKEKGETLLCQTYPQSDLHISVPYHANKVQFIEEQPRTATILQLEKIAERNLSDIKRTAGNIEAEFVDSGQSDN